MANNTIRILYLNLNLLNIFIAIFLIFFKLNKSSDKTKDLTSFSTVLLTEALLAGYIGCTGVWFKSKCWVRSQIALITILLPFFAISLIIYFYGNSSIFDEEISKYIIIALMVTEIPQAILGWKYISILDKDHANRKLATSRSVPMNLLSFQRSPTSANGLYLAENYPTLVEGTWHLAPFGRVTNFLPFDGLSLVASNNPGMNVSFTPTQMNRQTNVKEKINESTV